MLLILAELTSRLFFVVSGRDVKAFGLPDYLYRPVAFLGYELTPNFKLNHPLMAISVNRLGFRGKDFSAEKPEKTFRIVCLGGSSVFGYRLNDEESWPAQLEKRFHDGGYPFVEVINAGVAGYTTYHSLILLITRILDLNPDLVIVNQTWNDMKYWHFVSPDNPVYHHWSAVIKNPPSMIREISKGSYFIRFIYAVYGKLRAVLLSKTGTQEPFDYLHDGLDALSEEDLAYGKKVYKRNLELIAAVCGKYDIKLVLSTQVRLVKEVTSEKEDELITYFMPKALLLSSFDYADSAIKEVAEENPGAEFFDLAKKVPADLSAMEDHVHQTREGNRLIAEAFYEYLKPWIPEN